MAIRLRLYQQFLSGPMSPGPHQPRRLIQRLGERGHDVDVISGDVNVYDERKEEPEETCFPGGNAVRVFRLRTPKGLRRNLATRLRCYLGYAISAEWHSRKLIEPDLVLGSIQPMFAGSVAWRAARRARAPFVLEVRDLWPDALEAKGALSSSQARPLQHLVDRLYANATRVVSLTPGITDELVRKGVDPAKVDTMPNGFDRSLYDVPPDTRNRVRKQMAWGEDFVAIYVGTHVEVTAVDVIIRAAAALKNRPGLRFVLFGSGQRKPAVIQLARDLGLTNVSFHDPVPKARVPELLYAADVGLMSLFRSPLSHIYFENKLIDYLGAALPIVAAMDGMQGQILMDARAGLSVPSHDDAGMAEAIARLAEDRAEARRMGLRGREYVETRFLQSAILDRYVAMLEAVARGEAEGLEPFSPFA